MTQLITTNRPTLERALDALKSARTCLIENKPPGWQLTYNNCQKSIAALRQALDQQMKIKQPIAGLASYVSKDGELQYYTSTHYDLALEQPYIGDGILLQEEDELGWIDVPCDWSRTCPPTSARRFGCVEVMFVDRDTRMGHPNHWQMEWNCNSAYHILKYRDANSK